MADAPKSPPMDQMIEIDWSDEPPTVYANGAQLVHSATEFSMCFTEFANFTGRHAKGDGAVPRSRVVSSVRVHPEIFFQFVVACASNWNKFVDRFNPPGSTPPKFKLLNSGNLQLEGLEPPGESGDDR